MSGGVVVGIAAALAAVSAAPGSAAAQGVARDAYRRLPAPGGDPVAHVLGDGWSLGFHGHGVAANSALTLDDLGALLFLADRDSLRVGDALDALGLVPRGEGIGADGSGGAALRLGAPLGDGWTVGASVGVRAWSTAFADPDAVTLLRDGNASRTDFTLGGTRGDALLAAELGGHAAWRAGRVVGPAGPELTLAAGLRFQRPLYLGQGRSVLRDGGSIRITEDSVQARVAVATLESPSVEPTGGGVLADVLVRAVWPGPGFAAEASLTGLGAVTAEGLLERRERVDVATTRLDSVVDVVEGLSFEVRDTVEATVSPPASLYVALSTWALPSLQLDARLATPVGGDFHRPPPAAELLATFRPFARLPLRGGLRVGGHADLGYRLGGGWEGRRFFARISASTGGGLFGGSRGLGAEVALGFWL